MSQNSTEKPVKTDEKKLTPGDIATIKSDKEKIIKSNQTVKK